MSDYIETYHQITEQHISAALADAQRYDRLLGNRNESDAFPIPVGKVRLLSLVVMKLNEENKKKQEPAGKEIEVKRMAPPLRNGQRKAYDAIVELLKDGQVITTRLVADKCGWTSNTNASKHINTLIDLGYLKKVGKSGVIVLTDKAA